MTPPMGISDQPLIHCLPQKLQQVLTWKVFVAIDYNSLMVEQKRKALPALLFLTLKHDGSIIRGRACVDGRPQRIWRETQDSTSPINAMEALFYTLMMDAMVGRDVATCDLPGYFLQTGMEEYLLLWIDGALALILVKIID